MREPMPTFVPRSPAPTGVQLVAVGGIDVGRVFRVHDRATLGRGAECAVVLSGEDVSRCHAQIVKSEVGAFVVEDLGSTNGTFVNGERIERSSLVIGDKLRIGNSSVLHVAPYDPIEDELIERQRFETVGRLGIGIAHDFKNMLGVITASVDCIEQMTPEERAEEDLSQWLVDMRTAAERAGDLAKRLLEAAHREGGPSRPIDVTRLCTEIVHLARRGLPPGVEVVGEIAPGLIVRGDRSALYQVLMNLWVNARDAVQSSGTITIRAGRSDFDSKERVVLTVHDTGVGMDPVTLGRVFEPFYTTKAKGVGFGLGLAMVKETVERHGGEVQVTSVVGMGTEFTILLPPEMSHGLRNKDTGEHMRPGGGRVLVVDNELVLRRVYSRLLKREGYDVVVEKDGVAALAHWDEAPVKPDVVLLDLDMSGMDGFDVLSSLRKRHPGVRVILVTGSDPESVRARARESGAREVLPKPVSANKLLLSVATAVAQPNPPSRARTTPWFGLRSIVDSEDD